MPRLTRLICLVVLLVGASTATAAPISYDYTGAWDSFSSAPFGPTYVATIVFDNGGTSAANQTFTQADFISATLVSGSYNVTATPGDITSWSDDFDSNALGQLTNGWFDANIGGDGWHFDTTVSDEFFNALNGGSAGYFQSSTSNPGAPVAVPEPVSLGIWSLVGLAGLMGAARRRRQSA